MSISHWIIFAIACALVLGTLVIWKNKYFALVLSIALGPASAYMLVAVFSEYHEFLPSDKNGLQLQLVGGLLFTSLLMISIFMPKKYFVRKNNP